METIKKLNTNKSDIAFRARQVIGQAVLAAGAIGFIKQNLQGLNSFQVFAIGVGVVGLLLYFTNKR